MLLYGTEEPAVTLRRLSAGNLAVDLDGGNLRYLRWHGVEVIRAVSFVIRDTRWGTYAPVISGLAVEEQADGFAVRYAARCESAEGDFAYEAEIEGRADGTLTFSARGGTADGFTTNRTGFVVLHPLRGVVGQKLEVEHASGGQSVTTFPKLVSPGQPVFDIRELRHEPWPGARVAVRMEGDTFEMEDHRNWTDASFKTYVRPLALGFPYRIEPGEPFEQRISVHVSGPARPHDDVGQGVGVRVGSPAGRMPRVGLFLPEDAGNAGKESAAAVAALKPGYLVGRIDLREGHPTKRLDALLGKAKLYGTVLALEAVIAGRSPVAELAELASALPGRHIESLFILPARDLRMRPPGTTPAGEATLADILGVARELFPGSTLGGGSTTAFPELNRNRPAPGIDFVSHATQAIIHAADDISVMETLEALPDVIATVRSFAGDIPYRLGPATIGLPASAAASGSARNPAQRRVTVVEDDPRQRGLFAAAFALGYVATVAAHGVDAVTLAAPVGDFGLVEALNGQPYPIATAFRWLAAAARTTRLHIDLPPKSGIAALAIEGSGSPVLLLANLGADPRTIEMGNGFSSIEILDAAVLRSGSHAAAHPLSVSTVSLDSYAICRLS